MKFNGIDINQILGQIQSIVILIAGLVISVLILGTALRMAGHSIPYFTAVAETPLAYLCGAWCLFRYR